MSAMLLQNTQTHHCSILLGQMLADVIFLQGPVQKNVCIYFIYLLISA